MKYFQTLFEITFHPARYFRTMPTTGGASGPLAFALATHWLGTALEYLWHLGLGQAALPFIENLSRLAGDIAEVDNPGASAQLASLRDQALHWFWGAGSVVADPFLTLGSILFTTFLVYLGARILVNPSRDDNFQPVTYESALRIICFGMGPSILKLIPLVGGVLASVAITLVTVVAAREVYRTSTPRAVVIALFPRILLLVFFFGLFLLGILLFLKLMLAFF